MRKLFPFMMLLLLLASFVGCSKDSPTSSQNTPRDWQTAWNAHNEVLNLATDVFDSVVAISDTAGAIAATVSFLQQDTVQVDYAEYDGSEGISIGYKDGGMSAIIFNIPSDSRSYLSSTTKYLNRNIDEGDIIPSNQSTIFCDPFYTWFYPYDYNSYTNMCQELLKVNFPAPELVIDQEVSPSTIANLGSKGFIDLCSHGFSFMRNNIVTDIWFCLTINQNQSINSLFPDDIDISLHPVSIPASLIGYSNPGWINTYAIDPEFIRKYNQAGWQTSKPLIWGGFCSSFLFDWPEQMIGAGASCYLGWDGSVKAPVESDCFIKFCDFMCDTPKTWALETTVMAFYGSTTLPTSPQLMLAGDPGTSLQESIESGWTVGANHLTFESAIAGLNINHTLLVINFSNAPTLYPNIMVGGIEITGAQLWYPLISSGVSIFISPSISYQNVPGWIPPNYQPIYITLSQLDLTPPLGRVSGFISGYVFNSINPYLEPPIPVYCEFNNLTVNVP